MKNSNAVRYVSKFVEFDEEIRAQLGSLIGMSYCPDKKNKRGVKVFSMNGCNHKTMDDDAVKGYYFYIFLYRGSQRHQAGVFSGLG